jgi:hypothetical protein
MSDQPIAWGMPRPDGLILDVICPEEHAREPGQYTVPLYAAPQPKGEPQEPVGVVEYLMASNDGWLSKLPPGTKLYTAPQPKAEQEPGNWTVYNSGAEVASGLSFAEAWSYLTPERLARQWCAVCVVDKSNLPTAPQPRKRLDVHEILDLMPEGVPARYDGELIAFCRAIEAAVWGETE